MIALVHVRDEENHAKHENDKGAKAEPALSGKF